MRAQVCVNPSTKYLETQASLSCSLGRFCYEFFASFKWTKAFRDYLILLCFGFINIIPTIAAAAAKFTTVTHREILF